MSKFQMEICCFQSFPLLSLFIGNSWMPAEIASACKKPKEEEEEDTSYNEENQSFVWPWIHTGALIFPTCAMPSLWAAVNCLCFSLLCHRWVQELSLASLCRASMVNLRIDSPSSCISCFDFYLFFYFSLSFELLIQKHRTRKNGIYSYILRLFSMLWFINVVRTG